MRGDTLRKKRGAMGCLGLTRGDLFPRALSVPARLPHPIPMTSHRLSHQQLSFCCCLDGPLGLAMEETPRSLLPSSIWAYSPQNQGYWPGCTVLLLG